MAVELLGMIHARAGITRPTDPDDPDDPTPAPEHFRPTLISFDKDDYAPGETMTATVTGAPATDGTPPTVTYTDSAGRVWTVGTVTSDSITMTATA